MASLGCIFLGLVPSYQGHVCNGPKSDLLPAHHHPFGRYTNVRAVQNKTGAFFPLQKTQPFFQGNLPMLTAIHCPIPKATQLFYPRILRTNIFSGHTLDILYKMCLHYLANLADSFSTLKLSVLLSLVFLKELSCFGRRPNSQ